MLLYIRSKNTFIKILKLLIIYFLIIQLLKIKDSEYKPNFFWGPDHFTWKKHLSSVILFHTYFGWDLLDIPLIGYCFALHRSKHSKVVFLNISINVLNFYSNISILFFSLIYTFFDTILCTLVRLFYLYL